MKTKFLLLTMYLLASAVPLRAGEEVALDKSFAFRLTQPELSPPVAPTPSVTVRPDRRVDAPQKTPLGEPLPPGTRAFQFNGQTFYYIPL